MRLKRQTQVKTLSKRAFAVLLLFGLPISISTVLLGSSNGTFRSVLADEPVAPENSQSMKLLASVGSPSGVVESHGSIIDESVITPETNILGEDAEFYKSVSDEISIYVVRPGDTISQIAKMFGVSVNTIKWGNNLSGNTLKVGETLIILPISGVRHTVVRGDTLASIAKKYKGDLEEIANYNDLDTGAKLAVGTVIIVPDGEITAGSPSTSSSSGSNSTGLKEYAGYYMRPLVGSRKTQGIHGQNSIDFGAPVGTPILASAEGTVIIAKNGGWNGGYGSYVVVKHSNGTQTLYAHLSTVSVSQGQSVSQGDILGSIGRTGKATGIHLHFEIRGAKNPF